jgi:hypothetical protein
MSETNTPQYTPFYDGTQPPAPKKQAWWKKPAVLLPIGALLLGTAIGTSNRPAPVEVVKEVPGPERVVTKTEKVDVPTTPASCLTALDLSEQAFTYAAESMGYMNEALQAAGKFNTAGIEAAGEKLKVLNPKLTALSPQVNAAKAECRASAK